MTLEDILSKVQFNKQVAASVAALALVVFAGYLVYSYFSKVGAPTEELKVEEIEEMIGEIIPGEVETPGEVTAPEEKEVEEKGEVAGTAFSTWVANDYKEGDVTGSEYEVKWGDTLWEIAEARYGSGFEWYKIKDANPDKVGTLPNGRPLIIPGQILTLP